MIELPGWNDLISVNGFCYSSSMGESPKLNIPLKTSTAPTKGIAPDTFKRNSIATYIDDDGLLQTAGIDVIRFQNGRYLCEASGTNLLKYSQQFDISSWTKSQCSIQENYAMAPDNTLTAALYTILDINANLPQNITVPTDEATYTLSVWAKSIDLIGSYAMFVTDSTSVNTYLDEVHPITTQWVRYSSTFTKPYGITTIRVRPVRTVNSVGSILLWGAQVETGTKATSYIPTTTTPVTRAADALHYVVGDVITKGQGSLYCEFYNEVINSGASRVLLCLSDGTSSNRLYFQISTSNLLTFLVVTGGTTVGYLSGSAISVICLNKVLLTYADNNMRLYLNGAAAGEDLSGVINTTMNKLSAGCLENGTAQANRELGNIKYFKEVLTPAEAIKLTTL